MNFQLISTAFKHGYLSLFLLSASLLFYCEGSQAKKLDKQPNILVIVADDLGFADLGSFGSEIPTPNLDTLANNGVKFTNFITSSVCSPSRASLLTGASPHQLGFGNLKEELAPNQKGKPGYEGFLNDKALTISSLFKDAGYATMMTGKWHLGKKLEHSPLMKGFDQSFAMLTNASHFSDMRPAYSPDPKAKALYRENDTMLDSLPESFDYSSQFYVDRLIDYIDEEKDRPFFALLAFAAPHWPLQAPKQTIDTFKGDYDQGYEALANKRMKKQKELGLIPSDASLSRLDPGYKEWNELSDSQKQIEARSMEVYAAMVNEIDTHSGRLFEYLKQEKRFSNTIVIFLSDNGAEGHDLDATWPKEMFPKIRKTIDDTHDFSFDNMGLLNSYTLYGPGWARASAPAYAGYKGWHTEGGVRTAAFIHDPRQQFESKVFSNRVTIKDIPMTILDLAGIKHPGEIHKGKRYAPVIGHSILPSLANSEKHYNPVKQSSIVYVDETMGKISVRLGDWKLVNNPPPFGNKKWQLFNLANDLSESQDLHQQHPDKVSMLVAHWEAYKTENNVILPNWLSGY